MFLTMLHRHLRVFLSFSSSTTYNKMLLNFIEIDYGLMQFDCHVSSPSQQTLSSAKFYYALLYLLKGLLIINILYNVLITYSSHHRHH